MKLIITEEERNRILGMHQSAILNEQTTPTGQTQTQTEPQIGGGNAPSVMSIPNYNQFIVWNPSSKQYRFEAKPFEPTMINYLGGQQSLLSGIIGKKILITKQKVTDYEKMERFGLPNNSVDDFIIGSFVPKAWYVGALNALFGNGSAEFLYLFNREITTNYSGNIQKPIIENGVPSEVECEPSKANLVVYTQGGGRCNSVYVDDNKDVVKALQIKGLKAGTDYIRIRRYDCYCPEFKGYADYLLMVGIPGLGAMAGVTKIS